MSIIYTLVAKTNNVILCEYTEYSGNFQYISLIILKKIKPNKKCTIEYDK